MYCNCDLLVRCTVGKTGGQCYTCPLSKCRFYATAPLQADGYHRILPMAEKGGTRPSVDIYPIVRFEALLHPDKKTTHFTATPSTLGCGPLLSVLEAAEFQPEWYVPRRAYIYPMDSYDSLISALKKLTAPRVLLEEIPQFFFRCLREVREVMAQHEQNVSLSSSQDADPEDVVYTQLRPFQKRGVDFIVARGGRGMIADDMGLGKTVQGIAFAHHYRNEWPALIVCPLSLMENWAKELTRFCGIPAGRIATIHTTKLSTLDVYSVVIVAYSSLKCLDGIKETFKVVILDESHYIKSVDAKRTVSALKLCRSAKRVLLLSGTPTLSRPIELYPQLQTIMRSSWSPTKTQFGARYCNAFVGRFGIDFSGHSNMSELHVLLQQFVIRRTKKDMAGELPSKSRQMLYLYITPKERKAMEKDVLALKESFGSELADSSSPAPFALTTTADWSSPVAGSLGGSPSGSGLSKPMNAFELRIATARAKIPAVQDYMRSMAEQMVETGEKVIFFAHHQIMMDALRETVETANPKKPLDYIYVTGDTPAAQRDTLISHFRSTPTCHVAILSMHSCGVGHNMTCATMVVFAELDWNPSTHLQCEDRVHRIGQSSPCVIKYLLAEGTSDSVIWPLLRTKLTVTQAVMENGVVATGESSGHNENDWNADAHRVLRSDVDATPTLNGKKQTTLASYFNTATVDPKPQGDEHRSSVGRHSAGHGVESASEPTTPSGKPVLEDRQPIFLDIATFQRQREGTQANISFAPSPETCRTRCEASVEVVQRDAAKITMPNNVAGASAMSSPPVSANGVTSTIFRPGVTTGADLAMQMSKPCATLNSGACSALTSTMTPAVAPAAYPSPAVKKTPFITVPCSTEDYTSGAVNAVACKPSVAVTPVATSSCVSLSPGPTAAGSGAVGHEGSSSERMRFISPRAEALRHYNSRRTMFTLGSVAEKRPREKE
ncbi:putative DNA helicase [Trypanosoma vivax]|uniref:Putative DNA helicase n=1 Tax=Trypanosoma vivax (strain Y486) TaxID=1055687 RepID=G0UB75_TRYVY|nr:putative DNA helicase [Trypanosoma vivax]CCC53062.1 putative DNA helicase [Trypanosoma vivax Y486]